MTCRQGDDQKEVPRPPRRGAGGGTLRHFHVVVAALLALTPFALAEPNVFSDPVCIAEDPCVAPVLCVEGVSCAPTACGPAASCEGRTASATECNDKPLIEGRTCETNASGALFVRDGRGASTGVAVAASSSDGRVSLQNLPNTWASNSAGARLHLLGSDFGGVEATIYRSTIDTSNGNEARQHGASLTYESPAGERAGLVAGVVSFDGVPELCYARLMPVGSVECPRVLP